MLLGSRIVTKTVACIGRGRALLRFVFWVLTHAVGVGCRWILFDRRYQFLDELAAGTHTITERLGRLLDTQTAE